MCDPDEPPTNVGIAGQSGLSVGAIAVDPQSSAGLLDLDGRGQSAAGGGECDQRGEGDDAVKSEALVLMAFPLVLTLFTLGSCGYHVAGHTNLLPKTLNTVCIPAFTNVTPFATN